MKQPNSSRQREAQFQSDRRTRNADAVGAPTGANGKLSGVPSKTPPHKQKRRKYLREYVRQRQSFADTVDVV